MSGGESRFLFGGLLDAYLLSCVRSGVVSGRELLEAVGRSGLESVQPGSCIGFCGAWRVRV